MAQADVLDLFNCLVIDTSWQLNNITEANPVDTGLIAGGIVTDFTPSAAQVDILRKAFVPIDVITLFTRKERENGHYLDLIFKQFLHYVEVYGLNSPGLFNLTTLQGTIFAMRFVAGITQTELQDKVLNLLYMNAPIKDAAQLKRIIQSFDIEYDLNKIQNNEMRVILYRPTDTFTNGDDVVRYMCYKATNEMLLIKSKAVIDAIKATEFGASFLNIHEVPLAKVFNRHKRLILAAKKPHNAQAINRITRLSKTCHVPIRESIAKTFIGRALRDSDIDLSEALRHVSVRDKMKYLNLLAQRRLQSNTAAFKIRNGKVHIRTDRPVFEIAKIERVERAVLNSLSKDLAFLRNKNILLDELVDYGLPISRKQTVGNLPFGTRIESNSNEISSGIYWENEWGAHDLDLSTIDLEGRRVGWGQLSGYNDKGIIFSGDVTDASNGAMEFMTSRSQDYGLFVNIYSGRIGSKLELVVGTNRSKKEWIDKVLVREKHIMNSRQCVLGFVKGKTFVVYAGRLNNNRASFSRANPIINESKANFWTMSRLLSALDVHFDVDRQGDVEYDHDLSYESFSFDKLENMFTAA